MKTVKIALAAALAFAAVSAQATKIATQAWVINRLASHGIHVSTASTVQNSNGTFTVSGPFAAEELPGCVSLSLTFTNPELPVGATRKMMRGAKRDAPPQAEPLTITLTQGFWVDARKDKRYFNFGSGIVLTWPEELPEVPSSEHVCELDADCNCVRKGQKLTYPDDCPDEYLMLTMDDFDNAEFASIISWIDTDAWPDKTTVAGKTRYWITDDAGNRLNLEQVGKSDVWRDSVAKVEDKINERMRECWMAYYDSMVCLASNPQHDWQTASCGSHSWEECANNPQHTRGTKQHSFPGSARTAAAHFCACGNASEAHDWGDWVLTARYAAMLEYTRTCTVCGYSEKRTEMEASQSVCDTNNNIHVALDDACGCKCGKYGSGQGAEKSDDEKFHHWSDTTDANGVRTCTCACGHYHKMRRWGSNQSGVCENICAYSGCYKEGSGVGISDAADDRHTPMESGHCGCKCGKLTADNTMIEKFHIRKSGTCRCYGGDGNGGAWHFREPDPNCPNVCAHTVDNKRHLVALTAKEHTTDLVIAGKYDHTPHATSCGCACRAYTGSDYPPGNSESHRYHKSASESGLPNCGCKCLGGADWANAGYRNSPWHYWANGSCKCNCTLGNHHAVTNALCVKICRGGCGGLVDAPNTTARAEHHTPKEDNCGCKCGFVTSATKDETFHNGRNGCRCACGGTHKHFAPETVNGEVHCPNICDTCGRTREWYSGISYHSFLSDPCDCDCSHHHQEMGHDYNNNGTVVVIGSRVCATCGETVDIKRREYSCNRSSSHPKIYGGTFEDGHDEGCTDGGEESGNPPHEEAETFCSLCHHSMGVTASTAHDGAYCDECGHKCPAGGGSSSGDDNGGGGGITDGPGGLDDIDNGNTSIIIIH